MTLFTYQKVNPKKIKRMDILPNFSLLKVISFLNIIIHICLYTIHINIADFMKKVPLVYTYSMTTEGTIFRKSSVSTYIYIIHSFLCKLMFTVFVCLDKSGVTRLYFVFTFENNFSKWICPNSNLDCVSFKVLETIFVL